MKAPSRAEEADRISRRRARALPILGVVLVSQQVSFLTAPEEAYRLVDHLRIGAWLVLTMLLLGGLATSGAWFRPAEVRAMLNDESTREHRRTAYTYGFWAAAGAAMGLYVVDLFEAVSGRDAVHIVLTAAVATALLNFGMLERRAHRDA